MQNPNCHKAAMYAIAIPLLLVVLSLATPAAGKTFLLGNYGPHELELELDAYYSSVALTFSLTDQAIPVVPISSEDAIYKHLADNFFKPQFLIIEYSVNPMPLFGVYIKNNHHKLIEKPHIGDDFNVLKVLTSGFNEPHAITLFLTSVVNFAKWDGDTNKSRGYSGYLLTYGDYHIYNNTLIKDDWLEGEVKLKGSTFTDNRDMSWSFRVGGKFHRHPDIRDAYYLALNRDRIDRGDTELSVLRNSNGEFRLDFDSVTGAVAKTLILVGKSFPREDKTTFTISVGALRENFSNYRGDLADLQPASEWNFLIRPNIIF